MEAADWLMLRPIFPPWLPTYHLIIQDKVLVATWMWLPWKRKWCGFMDTRGFFSLLNSPVSWMPNKDKKKYRCTIDWFPETFSSPPASLAEESLSLWQRPNVQSLWFGEKRRVVCEEEGVKRETRKSKWTFNCGWARSRSAVKRPCYQRPSDQALRKSCWAENPNCTSLL